MATSNHESVTSIGASELDHDDNWLKKEELSSSRCCRFCSVGCNRMDKTQNLDFIPIFDEKTTSSEPLDLLINKFMPFRVAKEELNYPHFLCFDCFKSLEETIIFFKRIAQGQANLAKIINKSSSNLGKVKKGSQKLPEPLKMEYLADHPVLLVKKRRGRPRKDFSRRQSTSIDFKSLQEKPKRISRPPARFTNTSDAFLKEIKVKTRPKAKKLNFPIESKGNPSNKVVEHSISHSSSQNLIELAILMDGDEEHDFTSPSSQHIQHKFSENLQNPPNSNEFNEPPIETSLEEAPNSSNSIVKDSLKTFGPPKAKIKRAKSSKKEYKCSQCNKTYSSWSSLNYHQVSAHESVKKHACGLCGRRFSHKQLLINHQTTHSRVKSFKCNVEGCSACFKSRTSLHTLAKSVHNPKREFICGECGSGFNLKATYTSHMAIHSGIRPFSCDFCPKTFTQASNKRQHESIHTGHRPFGCSQCPKSFINSTQLKTHLLRHEGIKPYLCSICGVRFYNGMNFKFHMRTHTREKPHACPTCSKSFGHPLSLKKHLRIHSGEKPYTCQTCFKTFRDASNFARHKKLHSRAIEFPEMGENPSGMEFQEHGEPHTFTIETLELDQELLDRVGDGHVQILQSDSLLGSPSIIYVYPE